MSDIKKDTFPNQKKMRHVLDGLPAYLKEPESYDKVQKALYEVGGSTCGHSDLLEWAGCKKCQRKQWDRKEMMKKLGFQSGAQYMAWRKTHEYIKSRVPLVDWKNARPSK